MKSNRPQLVRGLAGHSFPQSSRRRFLQGVTASLALPWTASVARDDRPSGPLPATPVASSAPPPQIEHSGSDVGSLFSFIKSQSASASFPLSFLEPRHRQLATWKTAARQRLLDLLHYAPAPCDPRPIISERIDAGSYWLEKLTFNTTPDIRVPAFLLLPKNARKRAPGIVALHDHGGFYLWGKEKLVETADEHPSLKDFKLRSYQGQSIASNLARQGYVVLVIDMFYWGERRMLLDDDANDWRIPNQGITPERIAAFNQRAGQSEALVGRTIFSAGFTWAGVMFWDDIRSLDYLASRPEVDPERLGCVGLSVGGLRSCHLAALDDRIKATVIVGWMCSFPNQLKRHIRNTIGHTKLVPGLYKEMDYPDVASLAMPAALLAINGRKDGLFDEAGVNAAFDKLARCYQKAGISQKLQTRWYDTPHEFNLDMQQEAWSWLEKWI